MTVLKTLKGIAKHHQLCGTSMEVAPATLFDIIESLEAAEGRVAELEAELALGCQPPKEFVMLPDPSSDELLSTWQYRDSVVNALDAAGVKWKQAAGGSIADE